MPVDKDSPKTSIHDDEEIRAIHTKTLTSVGKRKATTRQQAKRNKWHMSVRTSSTIYSLNKTFSFLES